ncbi:MAG: adenylate/guanylate cyclase domain-containing protein [Candidatus Omnitrophota bacterium]|nr:adenylate/guanylate cyclase domain-containing protein [Candidatus Omnitrophota bacterium]
MSFRIKLILSMMLVVFGITSTVLYVTHNRIRATYEGLIHDMFGSQVEIFREKQESRLKHVKDECKKLARSIRLYAALEEGDEELIYQTAGDELRTATGEYVFYRLITADGEVVKGWDEKAGMNAPVPARQLEEQLGRAGLRAIAASARQQLGYMAMGESAGESVLYEVIYTPIAGFAEDDRIGGLAMGFPVSQFGSSGGGSHGQILGGILLGGRLYSSTIPSILRDPAVRQLTAESEKSAIAVQNYKVRIGKTQFRADYRPLNLESQFQVAFQVGLYSLENMKREQEAMTGQILFLGSVAMLAALILSLLLAHGLSGPVLALLSGTKEIQRGNLDVEVPVRSRDEIGQLTGSFNDMAKGLALKEKYRNMLNLVTDKEVAEQLMSGSIELGGETREASILFCDIRNFTQYTRGMDPREVVSFLNEHMTALTNVVYQYHGVVDKFVGDLIMAVFGAPKARGEDVHNAVSCGWQMIKERDRLNKTTKKKIEVGIGIATGTVLAGCMGSRDRLNYTVLGERVNLASRLSDKAGAQEILLDQQTRDRLRDVASTELVPGLDLKGFSEPVDAYRLLNINFLART